MTVLNKANLEILAKELPNIKENVKFDMGVFFEALDGKGERDFCIQPEYVDLHFDNDCGAVACALGHCMLISAFEEEIRSVRDINQYDDDYGWDDIAFILFGIEYDSLLWCYLFDHRWTDYDQTIEGVVKRIKTVLAVYNQLGPHMKEVSDIDSMYWDEFMPFLNK